jgi:hypothetical protein
VAVIQVLALETDDRMLVETEILAHGRELDEAWTYVGERQMNPKQTIIQKHTSNYIDS